MAGSPSSSSSSRSGVRAPAKSPIRYRQSPLDYKPEKKCWCRGDVQAAMWISWSDNNPGRRYLSCARTLAAGGCRFFTWVDPELKDQFLKQVLVDLRDEVRRLERLNEDLRGMNMELHEGDAPPVSKEVASMTAALEAVAASNAKKDEQILELGRQLQSRNVGTLIWAVACFLAVVWAYLASN